MYGLLLPMYSNFASSFQRNQKEVKVLLPVLLCMFSTSCGGTTTNNSPAEWTEQPQNTLAKLAYRTQFISTLVPFCYLLNLGLGEVTSVANLHIDASLLDFSVDAKRIGGFWYWYVAPKSQSTKAATSLNSNRETQPSVLGIVLLYLCVFCAPLTE